MSRILIGITAVGRVFVGLVFIAGLSACEDGMFEKAGENVDEAAEEVGDEVQDAGEEIKDEVDDNTR